MSEKFGEYLNVPVTETAICEYLIQFENLLKETVSCNLIYESVLEVLEQIDFWDWNKLSAETEKLVDKILHSCSNETSICILGNERDSSSRLVHRFNGRKEGKYRVADPESVLKEQKQYDLIFLDDGAYSGNQVISIFQEWMGVPDGKRKLEKNHVEVLSDEAQEKLKNRNIYLGYLNFNPNSEAYILSELQKLGLQHVQIIYLYPYRKAFEYLSFRDDVIRDTAKLCFQTAGQRIMSAKHGKKDGKNSKSDWTTDSLYRAGLGYNDAQQVIIYAYNTPTYTLTALWNDADTEQFQWKPLFLRKKSYRVRV